MPKPSPKGDDVEGRLAAGRARYTRATTAALASNSSVDRSSVTKAITNATKAAVSKVQQNNQGKADTQSVDPLRYIESELAGVLDTERLEDSTKATIGGILTFIRETVANERKKAGSAEDQTEANTISKLIKLDLAKVHEALSGQLNNIFDAVTATLVSTDKVQKEAAQTSDNVKDILNKVGKVNEATVKIASTTQSYSNALASKATPSNRANVDPRVIGDQERKARQILVEIFDEDGNKTLDKSLNDLLNKANEALDSIVDKDKPNVTKAVAALKTRKGAIVFTLNSKEAVNWVRVVDNEITFTDAFAKGSHIREREYNIIVPRIPITFDPQNEEHIRELEEVNHMKNNSIRKARWIKPVERRRLDQTHAYAILTILSANSANELIKEGLRICGTIVRPTKQKQEPTQCMKCRRWGHFANECTETENTCGTCGETHRTNVCSNRNKVYCVSCNVNTHTSWNRNCPEFSRRSAIMDDRNPGNGMPYFPTDQDWTLEVRPTRIPAEERFPARYAVNSLPSGGTKKPPPRNTQKRTAKYVYKPGTENPNRIPIASNNRNGVEGDPSGTVEHSERTHDPVEYDPGIEKEYEREKDHTDF